MDQEGFTSVCTAAMPHSDEVYLPSVRVRPSVTSWLMPEFGWDAVSFSYESQRTEIFFCDVNSLFFNDWFEFGPETRWCFKINLHCSLIQVLGHDPIWKDSFTFLLSLLFLIDLDVSPTASVLLSSHFVPNTHRDTVMVSWWLVLVGFFVFLFVFLWFFKVVYQNGRAILSHSLVESYVGFFFKNNRNCLSQASLTNDCRATLTLCGPCEYCSYLSK